MMSEITRESRDNLIQMPQRPNSYRLPPSLTSQRSIDVDFSYLSSVDRLMVKASDLPDRLNVYNSIGQPVLTVKTDDSTRLLLRDLHDKTLWDIQLGKKWLKMKLFTL
jgi:hypothetical protein